MCRYSFMTNQIVQKLIESYPLWNLRESLKQRNMPVVIRKFAVPIRWGTISTFSRKFANVLISNEELIRRVRADTICGRQPLILMKISAAHPQLRKEYWASTMCDSSFPFINFVVGGTGWCETRIPLLFCAVDVGVGFRILLPGCCGCCLGM